MVHQHNNEDHILLGQVVDRIGDVLQDLYVHHHNGNTKLNKRIMRGKELQVELKTLLQQHSKQTLSVDDEWKKGQEAIKELDKIKVNRKTILFRALGWGFGIIGTIIATITVANLVNK